MRIQSRTVAALAIAVMLGAAGADPSRADDILNNPYIILYARRVEIAKIEVDKHRAIAEYDAARYDRVRRLYASSAASLEELQEAYSKSRVSAHMVSDFSLRVGEAEALLDIAKVRISAGLDMPICQRTDG